MKKKAKFIHIPNSEWSNGFTFYSGKQIVHMNKHKLDEYQKKIKIKK